MKQYWRREEQHEQSIDLDRALEILMISALFVAMEYFLDALSRRVKKKEKNQEQATIACVSTNHWSNGALNIVDFMALQDYDVYLKSSSLLYCDYFSTILLVYI